MSYPPQYNSAHGPPLELPHQHVPLHPHQHQQLQHISQEPILPDGTHLDPMQAAQQQQQQELAYGAQFPYQGEARISHMMPYPPLPEPEPLADSMAMAKKPRHSSRSAGASGSADGGSPSSENKSKRIFQACQNCRERKAKCDGAKPACTHCVTRQINCLYATERRMRGPNKKRGPGDPPPKRRRAMYTNQSNDVPPPQGPAYTLPESMAGLMMHAQGIFQSVDRDPFAHGNPVAAAAQPQYHPQPDMEHHMQVHPQQHAVAIPHPQAHQDPLLPPFDAQPPPQPAVQPVISAFNPNSFPTREEFAEALESYLGSISRKNREKALLTQEVYNDVLKLLLEGGDPNDTTTKIDINPDLDTPQFKFWVNKTFMIKNIGGVDVVAHNGKAVAVKEQLYAILVHCHAETQHGGRDRTCAMVNEHYSWIPKAFVELFVKTCPGCPRKIIAANKAKNAKAAGEPSASAPAKPTKGTKRARGSKRAGSGSMDEEQGDADEVDEATVAGLVALQGQVQAAGEGVTVPEALHGDAAVPGETVAEGEEGESDEDAEGTTKKGGRRTRTSNLRAKPTLRSKRLKVDHATAPTAVGLHTPIDRAEPKMENGSVANSHGEHLQLGYPPQDEAAQLSIAETTRPGDQQNIGGDMPLDPNLIEASLC